MINSLLWDDIYGIKLPKQNIHYFITEGNNPDVYKLSNVVQILDEDYKPVCAFEILTTENYKSLRHLPLHYLEGFESFESYCTAIQKLTNINLEANILLFQVNIVPLSQLL